MNLKTRLDIERRIRNKTVDVLIDAGYYLTVDDGEGTPVVRSKIKQEVKNNMGGVDEETLRVYKLNPEYDASKPSRENNRQHLCVGWIFFVYGNDGYDCINDHTTNLEEVLKPVTEYASKQEERYG